MTWQAYTVTLELQGDLHIGDLPLGFVARTHPYVPCHLPFFALIPAAVSALELPANKHESYKDVESFFKSCLCSTPLFIARENPTENAQDVLFPWDKDDRAEIEARYLDSRYGVSLQSDTRSALEGHLYETEVILASPRREFNLTDPKQAAPRPTRLCGAIFLCDRNAGDFTLTAAGKLSCLSTGKSATLSELLSRMSLGGDRSRSLGRVAALVAEPAPLKGPLHGLYTFDPEARDDYPVLRIPADTPGLLPLALPADDAEAAAIQGYPQILTGRRHTKQGAGLGMDPASVALAPGWISSRDCAIALTSPRCATLSTQS